MKVYIYENVQDFMEENESKLLEHEAITQLILFNGMVNRGSSTNDGLLFGKVVDRNEKAIIYFGNVLPYNLLINTADYSDGTSYKQTNISNDRKDSISNGRIDSISNGRKDSISNGRIDSISNDGKDSFNDDRKDSFNEENIEAISIKDAVITLADYIVDHNIYIKGLNANKNICDLFLPRFQELKQCDYWQHLAMDIMELKQLNYVTLAEGVSRKADLSEKELIARWIVDFAKDALDDDLKYEDQLLKAERMIHAGILQVYEIPGYGLVSMAAASRQLVNGVCINYVFTPKEYRGKGYAVSNMYVLSKEMLDKGNRFCTLFVDKKNPISNRVYKKIGYQIIENQYDYKIVFDTFG
jgi:hypothetical protein